MFKGVLNASMLWKAQDRKLAEIEYINLREFGIGSRKQVDDTPYGGGAGMLLRVEPVVAAIEYAKSRVESGEPRVILPTPRGKMYKQSDAKRLSSSYQDMIIVCPRYEGYDERITKYVDEQICVGNYILTGGEIPAMAIIDSIIRLIPGVLGDEMSPEIESFQTDDKTIEFPQYTRPEDFRGEKVPAVLLSGHHAEIDNWRQSKVKALQKPQE